MESTNSDHALLSDLLLKKKSVYKWTHALQPIFFKDQLYKENFKNQREEIQQNFCQIRIHYMLRWIGWTPIRPSKFYMGMTCWRKPSLSLLHRVHGSHRVTFIPLPPWVIGHIPLTITCQFACLSPPPPPPHISLFVDWGSAMISSLRLQVPEWSCCWKCGPWDRQSFYGGCELVLIITFKLDVICSILDHKIEMG